MLELLFDKFYNYSNNFRCHLNLITSFYYLFKVIVKSKYGETLTELVKVKRGDSVELMCKTPFEEPMSHCAFIDPLGAVHLVGTKNSIKSNGYILLSTLTVFKCFSFSANGNF